MPSRGESGAVERYLRAEVIRMLRITSRQLAGWERAGLIAVAESYSFYDLLQIRKLSELRAKKVRPAMIRASLDAMQRQVSGMQNPLLEAGVFSRGSRLTFRHEGRELDPLAGQFLLAFDRPKIVEARTAQRRVAKTGSELFVVAVAQSAPLRSLADQTRAGTGRRVDRARSEEHTT